MDLPSVSIRPREHAADNEKLESDFDPIQRALLRPVEATSVQCPPACRRRWDATKVFAPEGNAASSLGPVSNPACSKPRRVSLVAARLIHC